jgi:hypothetical protein
MFAVSVGAVDVMVEDPVINDSGTEHCQAIVQPVAFVSGLHVPRHAVAGCGAIGQSDFEVELVTVNVVFWPFVLFAHDATIAARVRGPTTP